MNVEVLNVWRRDGSHLVSFIAYQRLQLYVKAFFNERDEIEDAEPIDRDEWERLIRAYSTHVSGGNIQKLTLTGNVLGRGKKSMDKLAHLFKVGRITL